MKKFKHLAILITCFISFALCSCQRDLDIFVPDNNNTGQILSPSPVNASVNGQVVDENNNAVAGVTVRSGANTSTTDSRGLFSFRNIALDKYASVVTVERNGYFKGIRTFSATAGSSNYIKIKLLPKTLAGSVDASTGGSVTLANNATVALLANSVVVKSSGLPYSGSINIYAAPIDPTTSDISSTVPGSFQAVDAQNFRVILKSYGMMAVQLESASGELLQISPGKKASLRFSIPASLSSTAPSTIPLWSMDETDGLWKQDGQATKSGSFYEGDVAHFSFWNCDAGNNTVYLELTVNTLAGPLPGTLVKITRVNNGAFTYGYTDSAGHVGGLVFSNEPMVLEILSTCQQSIYTQNIGPFTTNTNLGNITVTLPTVSSLTISGTAVDCNAAPITNGNALIFWEGQLLSTAITNGNFTVTITRCNSSASNIEVIVVDNSSQQQSTTWTGSASTGSVNTGALSACAITTQQFINYTINGVNYSFTAPADSITLSQGSGTANASLSGSNNSNDYLNMSMNFVGIGVGSSQLLQFFYATQIPSTQLNIPNPIFVTITEYGSVGQFISGNFSGIMINNNGPVPVTYNISCSFRTRRNF